MKFFFSINNFHFSNNRLLFHSLCPSINGYELVKAALLMGLFGGRDGVGN
jgi:DNA replicative helicase MCM subunit Mcm2 (Cdc46/Mcm family)